MKALQKTPAAITVKTAWELRNMDFTGS